MVEIDPKIKIVWQISNMRNNAIDKDQLQDTKIAKIKELSIKDLPRLPVLEKSNRHISKTLKVPWTI